LFVHIWLLSQAWFGMHIPFEPVGSGEHVPGAEPVHV